MKKILLFPSTLLIVAFASAYFGEKLEEKFPLPLLGDLWTGVVWSLLLTIIALGLEWLRNQFLFYDRIKGVITALREMRNNQGVEIPAIYVQKFMKAVVSEFKRTLGVRKFTIRKSHFDKQVNLPCGTCGILHSTVEDGNCSNCELPPSLWAGLVKRK